MVAQKEQMTTKDSNEQQTLTPREAAELLKVHVVTVGKWIRSGVLPAVKVGGRWRITHRALDRLLQLDA